MFLTIITVKSAGFVFTFEIIDASLSVTTASIKAVVSPKWRWNGMIVLKRSMQVYNIQKQQRDEVGRNSEANVSAAEM